MAKSLSIYIADMYKNVANYKYSRLSGKAS